MARAVNLWGLHNLGPNSINMGPKIFDSCSLPKRFCSFPSEMTKIPLRELLTGMTRA